MSDMMKNKAKPAATPFTPEPPKFETPKFDAPNVEMPAAFREFAEKGASQAKENWDKLKSASEQATGLMEDSYVTATKGASDYGLKVIEMSRVNTNAMFDFASKLMMVKSMSEMVELSTAHMRQQFEVAGTQSRDLTSLAQKVATETAEPLKAGIGQAIKKTV